MHADNSNILWSLCRQIWFIYVEYSLWQMAFITHLEVCLSLCISDPAWWDCSLSWLWTRQDGCPTGWSWQTAVQPPCCQGLLAGGQTRETDWTASWETEERSSRKTAGRGEAETLRTRCWAAETETKGGWIAAATGRESQGRDWG